MKLESNSITWKSYLMRIYDIQRGDILRLRDLLIHAFQLPLPPFWANAAVDLPSSAAFKCCGFLHSIKLRAPSDPIVSQGLIAAIKFHTDYKY